VTEITHFKENAIFRIFGGDFFLARKNGLYSVNFALNPINFADKREELGVKR
jgi:hypothetical protein